MPALGVCLILVSALSAPLDAATTTPAPAESALARPNAPLFVPTTAFTLAWTHSIEKVRWEEDYRIEIDPATALPRLLATAARIKGSGAGMEPPPDAVLRGGWYHYTPAIAYPATLRLTRSEFTPDYDWCVAGECHPMSTLIAGDASLTSVRACLDTQK